MSNGKDIRKAQKAIKAGKPVIDPYKQDVLYTDMGQLMYPGQVTKIPSNQITMEGVNYPVKGIDDTGYSQMMYPGMNYTFPGQYVTEYPQMQTAQYGGWLDEYGDGAEKRKIPQSGIVVDKRTNIGYAMGDDGNTRTFNVLTGKNVDLNKNYSYKQLDKNPNLGNTSVGYYLFQKEMKKIKGDDDDKHYKNKIRYIDPISAFGQAAPEASDLAFHRLYSDNAYDPNDKEFNRRKSLLNQSNSKMRCGSWGCVNVDDYTYDNVNKMFPKQDTLLVLDSKNPKDLALLNQTKKRMKPSIDQDPSLAVGYKKMGGWLDDYQVGGLKSVTGPAPKLDAKTEAEGKRIASGYNNANKQNAQISQTRNWSQADQDHSNMVKARINNPASDLGILGANMASNITRFRNLTPEEIARVTDNPGETINLSSEMLKDGLINELVGYGATKVIPFVFKNAKKLLDASKNNKIKQVIDKKVVNIKYELPSKEKMKDLNGFIPRRQFIKEMQKEGLIGKDFKDLNYAASSTDKTNALTKLALDRKATRYRGVEGKVPNDGIYQQQSVPYGTFDMTKPAWNNDISAFEHMKNAGVDFNDPISIAKYQASYMPMHKYEYRSGMPHMSNLDALYSGHAPTGYGNYQIKITSPRDYSEGNYIDWFKKYHNPKNNLQDLAVKDGYYIKDFVPNTSYEMPVGLSKTDLTTVVGKRGQKMFDVDNTFPFMNYKKLNPKQELEFKDYVKGLEEDYNTGWKGKYQNGGWLDDLDTYQTAGQVNNRQDNTRVVIPNLPKDVFNEKNSFKKDWLSDAYEEDENVKLLKKQLAKNYQKNGLSKDQAKLLAEDAYRNVKHNKSLKETIPESTFEQHVPQDLTSKTFEVLANPLLAMKQYKGHRLPDHFSSADEDFMSPVNISNLGYQFLTRPGQLAFSSELGNEAIDNIKEGEYLQAGLNAAFTLPGVKVIKDAIKYKNKLNRVANIKEIRKVSNYLNKEGALENQGINELDQQYANRLELENDIPPPPTYEQYAEAQIDPLSRQDYILRNLQRIDPDPFNTMNSIGLREPNYELYNDLYDQSYSSAPVNRLPDIWTNYRKRQSLTQDLMNRSGVTKEQALERFNLKDKDLLSKMSAKDFKETVVKPTGDLAEYIPGPSIKQMTYKSELGDKQLKDAILMSKEEYSTAFNDRLDLLNNIIKKNNKTGIEYRVKELDPAGNLRFETPEQFIASSKPVPEHYLEALNKINEPDFLYKGYNNKLYFSNMSGAPGFTTKEEAKNWITDVVEKARGNRIPKHESTWHTDINPGNWRGEVEDIANTEYYKSIPGLNMRNTSSLFGYGTPKRGSGTYASINEYLKALDLGRVKAGFNSQTDNSFGLWNNAVKKGNAFGFYRTPDLVHGVMKSALPYIGTGALGAAALDQVSESSDIPQEKLGGQRRLKKATSKNIQSSINDLMLRNDLMQRNQTLFGPAGKRRYKPGLKYKEGGWLDQFDK